MHCAHCGNKYDIEEGVGSKSRFCSKTCLEDNERWAEQPSYKSNNIEEKAKKEKPKRYCPFMMIVAGLGKSDSDEERKAIMTCGREECQIWDLHKRDCELKHHTAIKARSKQ